MTTNLLKIGMSLLRKIESLGDYKAYIVGGTPRDALIGKESTDVDIATNCPMKVLADNLPTYNIGNSKDFGVLAVIYKGKSFEVAQFRSDGNYSDGRRPDNVEILQDFKSDSSRRDFTINSMGMDSEGKILDYHNGSVDIENKVVRTVGDPAARFREDYVRMIRAARFASIEGFTIEKHTRRSIRRLFKLINKVTPERIRGELVKAAEKSGPEFAKFILILDDLKLLSQILPEVTAMKYFKHDMAHHPEGPTVFDHVIACLKTMEDEYYVSKIAVLLHDIGKPISFQEDTYGWKLSYHRHEHKSAQLSEGICKRLKFSLFDTSAIIFAVKNHMKFHKVLDMKPSKISRLAANQYFYTLVDVAKADEFSRGETFMYHGEFKKIIERILEIKERWESRVVNHSIKLVDGNRVMKLTGLEPGKIIGDIKRLVEDRIMDEHLNPDNVELIDAMIINEAKDQLEK